MDYSTVNCCLLDELFEASSSAHNADVPVSSIVVSIL